MRRVDKDPWKQQVFEPTTPSRRKERGEFRDSRPIDGPEKVNAGLPPEG